ncbi:MAG: type 2 isopentenyl-diphosphate Delta-isomerase [Candidatus Bilamarchaeaceae archaeon]
MSIYKRKQDHIALSIKKESQYSFSAGFERILLIHNSLPECALSDVDLSTDFLGKKISAPLLICALTGGYPKAKKINRMLAAAAQNAGIAFGLGSQRAMIENPATADTFKVRDVAPDIPLLANIGAAQLNKYPIEKIESLVASVEADALAIHLNPLQEVIQPEGDTDFSGILAAIEKTVERIGVPVIAKETGAGMSTEVAEKLKGVGVSWLDVSGAGGTSWSKIEYMRKGGVPGFENWGIKTVDSILMCKGILPLIASGGVRSGVDVAKAIALGAEMGGAAQPFLIALTKKCLEEEIEKWKKQLAIAAFLTGSRNIEQLKAARCIIY